MDDINALYRSLLAADEARDAVALTAVAWQMYGELATTAADLGALRARFRVYAAAPHASTWRAPGNGQRPEFAASVPPRLGASQPSPTSGPDEGHKCWPRQDTGCLPAASLTALPPVASLGPDLPCTADPELFFAESPDDLEAAKALCRECPARATCLAGALERREPWGVWGGEFLLRGVIVPHKRPRGRPRKTDAAA